MFFSKFLLQNISIVVDPLSRIIHDLGTLYEDAEACEKENPLAPA
jgi:hypothetical protein